MSSSVRATAVWLCSREWSMHQERRRRLAYEVVRRKNRGESERGISRALSISRKTVRRLLKEERERRARGESALEREVGPPPVPRGSKLDRYQDKIEAWLKRYEDLTAVRLHELLQAEGFEGGYTIVRERLEKLRGPRKPKRAFEVVETLPGQQAQFDWSPYTLPGCGVKVQFWGCSLSWSRARAFEAHENSRQTTILNCLTHSFQTFGGVPQECVTDSMPGVVDRWECDQPILNVRFVDFAAYYNFAVDIAPRGCARYKGKKERTFRYAEGNLLNGREFESLEEFRDVLVWWRAERAMHRPHPVTKRPLWEMLAEEQPYLQPLPARPYDTRDVFIRLVDTSGYVQHATNFYRVPDKSIGDLVYVCVGTQSVEVYDRGVHRLAGHERLPDGSGQRKGRRASHRRRYDIALLLDRLGAWGPEAEAFGQRLRTSKRYAGAELNHVIGLQMTWSADDIVKAMVHAMRYHAYDARAVERILEARFHPRSLDEQIAETTRSRVREIMRDHPVQQRSLDSYATLRSGDRRSPDNGDTCHDDGSDEST